ncbi:MAG TPA: DUF3866 family protein [Gaiellaceae bacterium]|nr:DUF3866 family protein [Gaiellaceae bacterium]
MTAVRDQVPGLARIEVDGMPCVAYIDVTGPVEEGDDVLVNVQARELGLGSGGFDVLHANLSRGLELPAEPGAHVMKLPYTPIQFAVRHGEEDGGLPETLGGVPVVGCSLHSQVAPACAALRGVRVAYVQVPGGALPLALSDTVRSLRSDELLHLTIGAGACFGGDADAVNVHSALALAVARGAEAVVASIGPGIVGTATRLGHGGVAAAEALAAAAWLGGRAVLALRISEHDPRERHRGVSHHTDAVLSLSGGSYAVPWPEGCPVENPTADGATVVDVSGWRDACAGLPLSHMGRGPDDDPWFFAAAFAAGRLARGLAA